MPALPVDLPPVLLLAKPQPPVEIIEILKRDEGERLKLYRDSRGTWTIGYGRNLQARGINREEALLMLQNDILACQGELNVHIPWWKLLSPPRQLAMLSLCYNLGIFGLKDFKAALKAMEAGKYKEAARQFLHSHWAKQTGFRAKRIASLIEHDASPPGLKKP